MSGFFITILNMSVTASYVALVVIAIRYILAKCRIPKIYAYVLWTVVLFRLTVPVSFESAFSIIPGKTNVISPDLSYSENISANSGFIIEEHSLNSSFQPNISPVNLITGASPIQVFLEAGIFVWLLGIFILILYAIVSYVRLKRKLVFATHLQGNVFETDQIQMPFVLGFVNPKIYLPLGLSAEDAGYILKHEQTHIRRYDHLIKPLSYLLLVLHWFNPLMWLAYFLMIKDMEMSCDERVIKESNQDARIGYSRTLLSLSMKQSGLFAPLSFGENNVKSRIRNILNYRRLSLWAGMVVIVIVVASALSLFMNPTTVKDEMVNEQQIIALVDNFGSKLKTVSLINPQSEIANSMQENYTEFVSPELISYWMANVEHAPGRLTSSPWPERIDIESIKQSADKYEVIGRIVEVTEEGNVAATRPIKLDIQKIDERWLINSSMLGSYDSEFPSVTKSLAGYIALEEDTLYLDQVELITTEEGDRITGLDLHNPSRITKLGLQAEDMPNHYYIHNPDAESIVFKLIDGTVYTFTDVNLLYVEDAEGDRRYSTTNKEEYVEHLSSSFINTPFVGNVPYPVLIEVSDGKVMSITEIFLFTQ